MFGSTILEVGIGLVLVFMLMSLITTAITEMIAARLASRAKTLQAALTRMLTDPLRKALLAHPLIQGMTVANKDPTTIPVELFARAFTDLLHNDPSQFAREELKALARSLLPATSTLETLAGASAETVQQIESRVQNWFNASMQTWTYRYQRAAQQRAAWVAFVLAITFNVDTFDIAKTLFASPEARKAVVSTAQQVSQTPTSSGLSPVQAFHQYKDTLFTLELPVGWQTVGSEKPLLDWRWPEVWAVLSQVPRHLPGWILTALATAPGSVFWFNLLRQLLSWREALRPKDEQAST
jgi:hypothetical protein